MKKVYAITLVAYVATMIGSTFVIRIKDHNDQTVAAVLYAKWSK